MADWYMQHGKTEIGPGTEDHLRAAFEKGKITNSTKVRQDGSVKWVKLGSTGILDQAAFEVKIAKQAQSDEILSTIDSGDEQTTNGFRFNLFGFSAGIFKKKPAYNSPNPVNFGSIGERAAAIAVDGCILFAINFVVNRVFAQGALLSNCIILLYFTLMQYLWGYTVGRKIMGIHMEMDNRDRPTIGVFVLRFFMSLVSIIIFGIGFLMVLGDSKMRALHDRIAETRIVKD